MLFSIVRFISIHDRLPACLGASFLTCAWDLHFCDPSRDEVRAIQNDYMISGWLVDEAFLGLAALTGLLGAGGFNYIFRMIPVGSYHTTSLRVPNFMVIGSSRDPKPKIG